MRRNSIVIAAVMFFCAAVSMSAQGKPDFSGKWILDPASAPAPAGGGGGLVGGVVQEFTAKQDAKMLTITRMQGDQTVTVIYNLDGSETKNTVQAPGGPREQVSKATWDGNKLVIAQSLSVGGNTVEQKRVMSMEGGNLVIEQTAPGRGGGQPTTTKLVYKKG